MFAYALAFLLGDLFLQRFSQLPDAFIVCASLILSFVICIVLLTMRYTNVTYKMMAFILGFAWTYWYAHSFLSWTLPKIWEGKPLIATGYIASLPETDHGQIHFLFALKQIQNGNEMKTGHARIRLTWRDTPLKISVGDEWKLLVRLKRIHATQNLGAFDYEAWSLQKGLRASGVVMQSESNRLLSHHWYRYPLNQFRQRLQDKIKQQLPSSHVAPWLIALTLGEHADVAQEDWQVLRNTGTNHLMAIAGLHIGIIAGLTHVCISWLWKRFSLLTLLLSAREASAIAALMVAFTYSALAGFSLPTQRACTMLSVTIFALLARRKISTWQSWSLALLLVLLLNPFNVLTESFWLSFGTIALIIYGMSSRLSPSGIWWKWGRVQWVIGIGLIPLSLFLFQQSSLVSFFANSIAIPWLGFLVLPFCFLSSLFLFIHPLATLLLWIADKNLSGLWWLLTAFSNLSFASWHQSIPTLSILLTTIMAFLLLLLPNGFSGRWIGIFWLTPLLFYKPDVPAVGNVWMTLLDVGQGLAVVIQTKQHVLVYDAGPKYNTKIDMGENVVLPYLNKIGRKSIDMIVVSHGDNDHLGGVAALLKNISVKEIRTSVPQRISFANIHYCLSDEAWQWDGVKFSFIYPTNDKLNRGNDSSCVLRIEGGNQVILLTGDIEKNAEQDLLNFNRRLAATILIAPHHGSKTSGLKEFIQAVNPRWVIYATGYRNRYHFPHASVVRTYTDIQAKQFATADTGMMQFKLEKENKFPSIELYRLTHKRYWMD